MPLLDMKNIRLSFGGPLLLDNATLVIDPGERICLLGRNGEGKSSLIKIIHGTLSPDCGEIVRQQGLRIGMLEQEVPGGMPGTVFDVVAGGIEGPGALVAEYHAVSMRMQTDHAASLTRRLGELQHQLEIEGGWQIEQKIAAVLSRLALPADAPFATLSAGLKRRTLLGRSLAGQPDMLLLDEPTNHLDIESIDWMEDFLLKFEGSILFVTHDRMFLRRLATRIVELDRGRLTSMPGDYAAYEKRKQAELAAEETQQQAFDKKLAREEAWIRQGVKARRTRNEGRVRELEQLRSRRRERRLIPGMVQMSADDAGLSGRIVCEVTGATFGYTEKPVIKNFSATILRGDRIGIIGPNGAGKTTLIRLLLGDVQPQSGTVRLGTNLEIAYFDQLRGQLDDRKTVFDNVADGNHMVTIDGKSRHVYGYLQDFLFAPERARSPVASLSGGERNRLLLAKLFTRPSNLLVLDEPTNDLDVETLELLEELLLKYAGTVLLVSHDRAFLNNVVTSTIVCEGDGRLSECVGGYDDWLRQRVQPEQDTPRQKSAARPQREKQHLKRKLTFKQQREIEQLPARIEQLEAEHQSLYERLSDPELYRQDGAAVTHIKARYQDIEREMALLYERWQELEEING
ncbi:MAG: ATP-binding cassette domain-containing protein [Deltaproteobacteria bacterium]|nr:ATP-binding cassette domain-containing protein [Deltaproteobacteria bacterium]